MGLCVTGGLVGGIGHGAKSRPAKTVGLGVFIFGLGVIASDFIGVLMQTGMPWERKDFILPGSVTYKKLPPWTDGRTGEQFMADDCKAAIWRGKNDPRIRQKAIEIIQAKGLDGRQFKEIASAIQDWVRSNITYVHDMKGTELFQEAYKTLEIKAGDCDDQAILTAALLMSVGITVKIILLSLDPDFDPKISKFTHIFAATVIDGHDYWVETILPEYSFDYRHPYTGLMAIDMTTPSSTKKEVLRPNEYVGGLFHLRNRQENLASLVV